jgi:hypothetical protein
MINAKIIDLFGLQNMRKKRKFFGKKIWNVLGKNYIFAMQFLRM